MSAMLFQIRRNILSKCGISFRICSDKYNKISENMIIQLLELCRFKAKGESLRLSSAEKITIRISWSAYLSGDPTKRGLEMFLRMFKDHPETQKLFSFANKSSTGQMQSSSRLLFHVTRVVKYIGIVVANLDNLEEVVPMLKQLGGRHGEKGYKVPACYIPYLGEAMRDLMREGLPNYSDATAKLWERLFDGFISNQIAIGIQEYGNTDY